MSWQSSLDPQSKDFLTEGLALRRSAAPAESNPQLEQTLEYINQTYGWLKPQDQLALAKAMASPEAIDMAAEMSGKNLVDNSQRELNQAEEGVGRVAQRVISTVKIPFQAAGKALDAVPFAFEALNTAGGWVKSGIEHPGVKTATRYGIALLDAIPESINNLGAIVFSSHARNKGFGDFWNSLSIATLIENPELQGEGFIVGQALREEQGRRARDFRGEVNGSAWSVGRGAANVFFAGDSAQYAYMSGIIDAAVTLFSFDPTKLVSKGTRALNVRKAVLLSSTEVEEFGRVARAAGGLERNIAGASLNAQKFNDMLDNVPEMRRLVDHLSENTDELDIFERIFKSDMPVDIVVDLAAAKTRDEVKIALAKAWEIGKDTLDPNYRQYAKIRNKAFGYERIPLIDGIRSARVFREMPGSQVIINGTTRERTESVKNLLNSARAAGASRDEVRQLAKTVIPAFRKGSTENAQKGALEAFEATTKLLLRKNGVNETIIGEVINGPKGFVDKIRSYMVDRAGVETDFGFMRVVADMMKDEFGAEFWADWFERFSRLDGTVVIDRPMQLVEMLSRVQMLPDARVLRRLTRNPLMANLLSTETGPLIGKIPIAGARESRLVEVITDKPKYNLLQKQAKDIKGRLAQLDADQNPDAYTIFKDKLDDIEEEMDGLIGQKTMRVQTGSQRLPWWVLEKLQNAAWKPLNLATGGYVVRNSIDAQLRMHFGSGTGVLHPFDYISLLLATNKDTAIRRALDYSGLRKATKTRRRSVLGEKIVATRSEMSAGDPTAVLAGLKKEGRDFMGGSMARQGMAEPDVGKHAYLTNNWTTVSRQQGKALHTNGVIGNLRQIREDPFQIIAAREIVFGQPMFDEFLAAIDPISGAENFEKIRQVFLRGIPTVDRQGKVLFSPPIDIATLLPAQQKRLFDAHWKTIVRQNVSVNTGELREMAFMAAFGVVPDYGKMTNITLDSIAKLEDAVTLNLDNVKLGSRVVLKDGTVGRITALGVGDKNLATFVPTLGPAGLDTMYGSRRAQRLVGQMPLYDTATKKGLPDRVRREVVVGSRFDKVESANVVQRYDRSIDWLFSELHDGRYVRHMERSPVYRKAYWENVMELLPNAKSDSAARLLKKLRLDAKASKMTVDEYVGMADVEATMAKAAATKNKRGATLTQIDDFARSQAIDFTKELLYDASSRSNLEDMLRVIAPFAVAWREIIGNWMTRMAYDGSRITRSYQRVYTGLSQADPDKDGRGFFWEDPQTGDMKFMFPFSNSIVPLIQRMIPGGGTPLKGIVEAPVKQLSQGIQVFPALGPMAQFAAGEFLPRDSDYATMRDLLLPYGEKTLTQTFNPAPGWSQKLYELIMADTSAVGSVYANTFAETWRAKFAAGGYDRTNEDDMQKLFDDAKWDARWLTGLRVLSQFFGPTSGSVELKVPTEQGDVFVGEAIKFLQDLQAADYDNAVPFFLDTLGTDMSYYVASKTRSLQRGIEGSEEFGRWESDHPELMRGRYKNVAGYFAPTGSELNFSVWTRQIKEGRRENLTVDEMREEAEKRIGSALFAHARRLIGANRTDRQREILSGYREYLHEKYPGFPPFVEFTVNQVKNDVALLEELVTRDDLQDSPIIDPLTTYLNARREAYARGGDSISGNKRQMLRAELFSLGEGLSMRFPEFDRIWNRLLVQEVDE